jgi:hypothetical protein
MRINKYFPFAFIYFFINTVGLPMGLLFTQLLTPFLYSWTVLKYRKEFVWLFFLFTLPFIFIHLSEDIVDLKSYFVSYLLYLSVYIFCFTFYIFLNTVHNLENIFRKVLYINFTLCLVAIPVYFSSYRHLFWIVQDVSEGITAFRRLRMFTYEPSYYSTLFVPIFFYYLVQIAFSKNKINAWFLLTMLGLPLFLSFSLGVIGAAVVALTVWYFVFFARMHTQPRIMFSLYLFITLSLSSLVFLGIFYPENPLFLRISNVFSGSDTSGNGRTYEAFQLAYQIAAEKNIWFGVGFGQIKVIGKDIIQNYYMYPPDYVIAIPNASAETLAIFGITGFILRIGVEVFLFFRRKVWNSYYRFLLFMFIFVYQFTGSFITNIAEYVIWILAFSSALPEPSSFWLSNNISKKSI